MDFKTKIDDFFNTNKKFDKMNNFREFHYKDIFGYKDYINNERIDSIFFKNGYIYFPREKKLLLNGKIIIKAFDIDHFQNKLIRYFGGNRLANYHMQLIIRENKKKSKEDRKTLAFISSWKKDG